MRRTNDEEEERSYEARRTVLTRRFALAVNAKARMAAVDEQDGTIIQLDGHLFDSGLINNVLDLVEDRACEVDIIKMEVRGEDGKSHAVLSVTGDQKDSVIAEIEDLVPKLPRAEATCAVYEKGTPAVVTDLNQKQVLVLGAGRVANSFAEYVGRRDDRKVIVCGNVEAEVKSVAGEAKFGEGICFGEPRERSDRDPSEASIKRTLRG